MRYLCTILNTPLQVGDPPVSAMEYISLPLPADIIIYTPALSLPSTMIFTLLLHMLLYNPQPTLLPSCPLITPSCLISTNDTKRLVGLETSGRGYQTPIERAHRENPEKRHCTMQENSMGMYTVDVSYNAASQHILL